MTPFETLVAELERAAGQHYLHSSQETLQRLEAAREALLSREARIRSLIAALWHAK